MNISSNSDSNTYPFIKRMEKEPNDKDFNEVNVIILHYKQCFCVGFVAYIWHWAIRFASDLDL